MIIKKVKVITNKRVRIITVPITDNRIDEIEEATHYIKKHFPIERIIKVQEQS